MADSRLHRQLRHAVSYSGQTFDAASGQMYCEKSVAAPKSMLGTILMPRVLYDHDAKSRTDTRSLEDLAMREVMRNIDWLTSDSLVEVPSHIARRIWSAANQHCVASATLWRLLAQTYPEEDFAHYYAHVDLRVESPMSEYIDFLSAPHEKWLSMLTLTSSRIGMSDLMSLSLLRNLTALDICGSDFTENNTFIDDFAIRNWSRHAEETSAFQHLRVLVLRKQSDITSKVFAYLNKFPSLTIFAIGQPFQEGGISLADEQIANTHGWNSHEPKTESLQSKLRRESSAWDDDLQLLLQVAGEMSQNDHLATVSELKEKPLLHLRLGQISSQVTFSKPLIFFRKAPVTEMERSNYCKHRLSQSSSKSPALSSAKPSHPRKRFRPNMAKLLSEFGTPCCTS